eukprot:TRINITY_DN17550_c0_g1_i4.p1 TRINITY_DN17550_c0_g1~~TRINITY_DN17550_c0_g1_i4.p1  ORF type:complete len:594 (+),score=123.74 TRINITY_DN17550_c0_g1_i4:71-1852(+)
MEPVVSAINAIAGRVRPCFGPLGQDQLVVTESQKLVTNSAARTLGHSKAGSPIASLLLKHIVKTGSDLGDGAGTLSLMLDGALSHCSRLLADGRLKRAELQRMFCLIEQEIVPDIVVPLQEALCAERLWAPAAASRQAGCYSWGEEELQSVAEACFGGLARGFFGANFAPDVSEQLRLVCWSWLGANAACALNASESLGSIRALLGAARKLQEDDLIQIPAAKLAGANSAAGGTGAPAAVVGSSSVVRAHFITGVLGHASMPAEVKDACYAVVLDEAAAPLPLRVTAPAAMQAKLSELLLLCTERLWQLGVRLAFCSAEVHEEWRGALARRGIALLHLVDEGELALLLRAIPPKVAAMRVRLASDDRAKLQQALFPLSGLRACEPRSSPELAAGRALWLLAPADEASVPHCWLLLRAKTVGLAQEYRHALQRLLRTVEPLFESLLRAEPSLQETGSKTAEKRYTLPAAPAVYGGLALELALLRKAQSHCNMATVLASTAAAGLHTPSAGDTVEEERRQLSQLRLTRECWLILREALLNVVEAFIRNLLASGHTDESTSGGGYAKKDARRLALWLASADEDSLDGLPGTQFGLR